MSAERSIIFIHPHGSKVAFTQTPRWKFWWWFLGMPPAWVFLPAYAYVARPKVKPGTRESEWSKLQLLVLADRAHMWECRWYD
ncbi:MAG TPA: hypothetical protein VKQ30_20775 [Ktedonobacterales bacterium]|nr:hypothetical protein [Ktedonobacterales bacterium]